MPELKLRFPNSLIFGADVLAHLPHVVREHGTRVLLVSEAIMHDGRYVDRAADAMRRAGIDVIVFDEVTPNSSAASIAELANMARASQTKVVVGLGGVRVLALARLVANVATPERRTVEEVMNGALPEHPLAYIEVPSSFRNHMLFRSQAVLREEGSGAARLVNLHPSTMRAAVVDTSFLQTLSSKYTMAAIIDTLLAAIEGYVSRTGTFFSDALLERSISELRAAALSGVRNPSDQRYRARAAEAGLLTALGLSASNQGLGGALAYTVNARFRLPKSWVAAVLLPHVVDMLITQVPDKMVSVARALGEPVEGIMAEEDARRAARGVRRILSQLDLPTRLRDMDVSLDELLSAAERLGEFDMLRSAPTNTAMADVQALIKLAY